MSGEEEKFDGLFMTAIQ